MQSGEGGLTKVALSSPDGRCVRVLPLFIALYLEAPQRHPSSNALKPGPQHLLVDVEWMVYSFIEHTEIFGDVTFVVVV